MKFSVSSLSIRHRLLLLVLVIVLPVTAIGVSFISEQVKEARETGFSEVKVVADDVAASLATILRDNELVLSRLAERPLVRALDAKHCDPILAEYISLHPEVSTLAVRDIHANLVCTLVANPPAADEVRNAPWFVEVMRSGKFTAGDAAFIARRGMWVSISAFPIRDQSGSISGVIFFSNDLLKLSRQVLGSIHKNALAGVIDGERRVLLRSIDPEHWIGREPASLSEAGSEAPGDKPAGFFTAPDSNGTRRLYAFTPIPGGNWRVYAGLAEDEVLAQSRTTIMRSVGLGIGVLALLLALAWWLAEAIAKPIRELAKTSAQISGGNTAARAHVAGPDEVRTVAQQFNQMLDVRESADAALRASEERMRLFFERQIVGLAITSPERGWLKVNDKLCQMLGYTREELACVTWADLTHPDDLAVDVEQFNRVLSGDIDGYSLDKRFLCKDRRVVYASISVGCVRHSDRSVDYFLAVLADITERQQAEQRIADALNLNRAILRASPQGIFVYKASGPCVSVNDAAAAITGGTKEQLLKQDFRQNEAWKLHGLLEAAEAALATQTEKELEVEVTFSFGGRAWMHYQYVPFHYANEPHLLLTATDVTERKRAEQAVHAESRRFRETMAAAIDGLHIVDFEGHLVEANPAFLNMLGYTREELLGHHVSDWDVGLDRERTRANFHKANKQSIRRRTETKHQRKDGSVIDVEISVSSVEIDGRNYFYVASRDITERKRSNEMRANSQKLEALGTLAGGIAHDFNNILAAIMGNAHLAVQDVGPEHPAKESLREIEKAGARAKELVRRIMAFGRPKEPHLGQIDLASVVQEVLRLLRSTLPATVELRTRFADGVHQVLADAAQVHETVVNLTTNAAHAIGHRAGSIEYILDTEDLEASKAARLNVPRGQYARLTVKDNGCGIDEVTKGKIFDAFFTTKPVGEGTGLGLSMVHGVMKGHGGAIDVDSELGQGSSFHLYFPVAKEKRMPEAEAVKPALSGFPGKRVMYVDDEEALVSLGKRALVRLGHDVAGFTNPEEALEAFRAQPNDFDVVVTDLAMPLISGIDFARQLRAIRPDMPVLVTTGNASAVDEARAREAGIRELILKPVTFDELCQTINRLLSEKNAST